VTARCPSDLALEAHQLDPARSPVADHVRACARCAGRLEQMRAEGEDFSLLVFPRTVAAVEAAAARRAWWRRPIALLPLPALAGLAAVLLWLRPGGMPPEGYVGVKGGGGLGLTLFTPGPAGVTAVPDRGEIRSGASLRFRIHSDADCHLRILSIDATGAVSRLYPAPGEEPRGFVTAGEHDLPGGAILDRNPGPERVFAFCSPHTSAWGMVEGLVRHGTARPASVRRPSLEVPRGTAWTTLLLEKGP